MSSFTVTDTSKPKWVCRFVPIDPIECSVDCLINRSIMLIVRWDCYPLIDRSIQCMIPIVLNLEFCFSFHRAKPTISIIWLRTRTTEKWLRAPQPITTTMVTITALGLIAVDHMVTITMATTMDPTMGHITMDPTTMGLTMVVLTITTATQDIRRIKYIEAWKIASTL